MTSEDFHKLPQLTQPRQQQQQHQQVRQQQPHHQQLQQRPHQQQKQAPLPQHHISQINSGHSQRLQTGSHPRPAHPVQQLQLSPEDEQLLPQPGACVI